MYFFFFLLISFSVTNIFFSDFTTYKIENDKARGRTPTTTTDSEEQEEDRYKDDDGLETQMCLKPMVCFFFSFSFLLY